MYYIAGEYECRDGKSEKGCVSKIQLEQHFDGETEFALWKPRLTSHACVLSLALVGRHIYCVLIY